MTTSSNKKAYLGIGDHKGGLGHWTLQRITAILLIPLSLLFLFTFIANFGNGHAAMLQSYSQPWNAIVAILFFAIVFYHLAIGLEAVIDDYIPDPHQHKLILRLSNMFCRAMSVIAVLSVLKILFST
ncbi:MAG TPA: succinate dehydrogenase, hydrophobic membrane anchor protein [Rhodobacteraceae bacterium]|jgi:succinate dehydrogenase / fumarate reductase membrane anchor subunit|nr:succinate dehydrogenase, hydrophobic membrane anchor protein [Paracoccaceae bacterium]